MVEHTDEEECTPFVHPQTARQVDYLHNVMKEFPDPDFQTSIQVVTAPAEQRTSDPSSLTSAVKEQLQSVPEQPQGRPVSIAAMGDIGRSSVMHRLHDAQSKVSSALLLVV